MSTITKLETIAFARLNNAEFAFFAGQICKYVDEGTTQSLHVPEEMYSAFSENYKKLVELVNQTRTAEETERIGELDRKMDNLLLYLFSVVKMGSSHPDNTKGEAARVLSIIMAPYSGIRELPQRQEVQAVEGLLADLKKKENAPRLAALGLTDDVTCCEELNNEWRTLIDSRAAAQAANPAQAVKPLREEMYEQYDALTTTIFAFSVASPSAALSAFITKVNKLIADTNQAYNQRIAERK